jgi:hypothetical protein
VKRALVVALAALAILGPACQPKGEEPCFPAAQPQDPPWLSHQTLTWDIDEMAEIAGVPDIEAPPSDAFVRAQRDLKTEFWLDAAKGFLPVALGDTHDGRNIRQIAQYQLAVALFRLGYYAEALRLFKDIAAARGNPLRDAAERWVQRAPCG